MKNIKYKINFKDIFYFRLLKLPYIKYSDTFIYESLKECTTNYRMVYDFLKTYNPNNIYFHNLHSYINYHRFIFFKDNFKYSCLYDIDQETYNAIPKNFYSEMIEPNIVKSEIIYKLQQINDKEVDSVVLNNIITVLDEEIFESPLIQKLNTINYIDEILRICERVLKRKLKFYFVSDEVVVYSDDEVYCAIPFISCEKKYI